MNFHRKYLKDKAAFQKSIDHILGWDFDRIIIAHGNIVEINGKAVFR